MNEDKEQGLAESTSQDIKEIAKNTQKTINMARKTASVAKTAAKAAGHAAAGNMVGAAAEVLKDKETLKTIGMIIAVVSIILSFLVVSFLYALPTSIFEALGNFTDYVKENYETIKLSNANVMLYKKSRHFPLEGKEGIIQKKEGVSDGKNTTKL